MPHLSFTGCCHSCVSRASNFSSLQMIMQTAVQTSLQIWMPYKFICFSITGYQSCVSPASLSFSTCCCRSELICFFTTPLPLIGTLEPSKVSSISDSSRQWRILPKAVWYPCVTTLCKQTSAVISFSLSLMPTKVTCQSKKPDWYATFSFTKQHRRLRCCCGTIYIFYHTFKTYPTAIETTVTRLLVGTPGYRVLQLLLLLLLRPAAAAAVI